MKGASATDAASPRPRPVAEHEATSDEGPTGGVAVAEKCRHVALAAGLVAAGVAFLALVGWHLTRWDRQWAVLARWLPASEYNFPMAQSTAVLTLVYSLGFTLYVWGPTRRTGRWVGGVAAALAAGLGLLKLVGLLVHRWGVDLTLEQRLVTSWGKEVTGESNLMSPLTATSFLLGGVALLLLCWRPLRGRRALYPFCVCVAAAVNFLALLGYSHGSRELYGGHVIPVALPTAVAWLALAVGLIAANGPDAFPLRPLAGRSARALLLRNLLPITVVTILVYSVLLTQVLARWGVTGPPAVGREVEVSQRKAALLAALSCLVFGAVVSVVATEVARVIGARLDRAEAERNHALAELRYAKEEAERFSRLKSQFLANMSHELRTPLNAILGYSEMLQEDAEEASQEHFLPDLRKIHAAGQHLLALINDILDLSKVEAGKTELCLETIDIRGMIDDVATTVRPLVQKNANTLEVQCGPELGSMHADRTRLRQCLFNLLSNAAKFTKKGVITLSAVRQKRAEEDWISFSVQDTGIGIGGEQAARIFEAFVQANPSTTREYGGTGLGLAITRRLCQLMGGDISLQSEPGKGSTFTMLIPAVVADRTAPPVPAAEGAPAGAAAAPDQPTVLVVDDDPAVRDIMRRWLVKAGFHVVTSASGEEGIRLAGRLRPRVVTLDVMMPGMDGWAVLLAMKADPLLADIPVIMITVVDDENLGHSLGAADYLTKPIERGRLLGIVKQHCRSSAPVQALVVEDDPSMRELLRRLLERDGYSVAEAANGRQALECMALHQPALILLDLMMPEMDGFDFIRELRVHADWQSIPVVVLTAKDLSAQDRRFLGDAAEGHGAVQRILEKGKYSREELLRQVHELVRQPGALPAVGSR